MQSLKLTVVYGMLQSALVTNKSETMYIKRLMREQVKQKDKADTMWELTNRKSSVKCRHHVFHQCLASNLRVHRFHPPE